jgi:hypothetical protein
MEVCYSWGYILLNVAQQDLLVVSLTNMYSETSTKPMTQNFKSEALDSAPLCMQ